jgi:coenzyme F420-reducing hydrogenase alpha subunit
MVGALSRVNNNFEQLSPEAKDLAKAGQLMNNLDNPYYNNVGQAVELVAAMDQAIDMLGRIKPHHELLAEIKPHVCRGVGAVEVPRGTLWHEYELDDTGHVTHANIITPTTQNLRSIEDDIKLYLPAIVDLPQEEMVDALEKLIRSYDPCLSCAAHFLRIERL